MDFSVDVYPSLESLTSPESSLESFTRLDLGLDSLLHEYSPILSPSSIYQTVQLSQITDMSSYESSPEPESSTVSSVVSSPRSTSSYGGRRSVTLDPEEITPPTKKIKGKQKSEQEHSRSSGNHAKRHQTKLACTWCRKLSKKCDAQRPCGRCVQFNRCSECVDASPRKPRAKGIDRGTYKKTRDLAVVDYQEAVNRRESYVSRMEKKGRHVPVGLSAEEILEATRKEEARNKEVLDMTKLSEPSTGMLQAFPDEQSFISFIPSTPSSPAESPLFDVLSPTDSSSATDYDEADFASWQWHTMDKFPTVMELVAAAQAAENARSHEAEEMNRWTEMALVA